MLVMVGIIVQVVTICCFLAAPSMAWSDIRGEVKKMERRDEKATITLPAPNPEGKISLERVMRGRASVRSFTTSLLTREEISQLLWSLQGITRSWGARTAPSAGALFPLEVYVVLPEGVFHYAPRPHQLTRTKAGDLRAPLARAALGQDCVRSAPAVFVIAAVYERTAKKYGSRAERYVLMEAGHAAQNLLLQATALGLGAVPVGAFHDEQVARVLDLPTPCAPLYLLPVGRPEG
ncbi:MAG: SagB/ThcOx family dehydrogenase [Syntrophales bacterium]|nr:SagB/ThcOx family dehydrogenase [Syntrophales bacterium]